MGTFLLICDCLKRCLLLLPLTITPAATLPPLHPPPTVLPPRLGPSLAVAWRLLSLQQEVLGSPRCGSLAFVTASRIWRSVSVGGVVQRVSSGGLTLGSSSVSLVVWTFLLAQGCGL